MGTPWCFAFISERMRANLIGKVAVIAATLSAPTTIASTSPRAMSAAAMLSQIKVPGMLSYTSSRTPSNASLDCTDGVSKQCSVRDARFPQRANHPQRRPVSRRGERPRVTARHDFNLLSILRVHRSQQSLRPLSPDGSARHVLRQHRLARLNHSSIIAPASPFAFRDVANDLILVLASPRFTAVGLDVYM